MRRVGFHREFPSPLPQVGLEHVARGHAEYVAQFDGGRGFAGVGREVRGVVPD